jgi:hypothetical protein
MFDIESTQDIIYNYNIIIMFKNTYNNYYIYIISLYRSMFTQSLLHNHYNHYIYIYDIYKHYMYMYKCTIMHTLRYITLHCIALHYIRTVYVYAYVYVYMYMNMYMCMFISICMCICESICICTVYVYLHMSICIYIYMT